MEGHLYDELAEMGDHHWWTVGRRHIARSVLAESLASPPDGGRVILDVGCGTGYMLEMLAEFGAVQGIDFSPQAIEYSKQRLGDGTDVRQGRIPEDVPTVPSVDLVTAFDVIEHLDDDASALRRFAGALRPGGMVMITVPAFQFLWSGHDVINHHKRRYTRSQLTCLLQEAGFVVDRVSYFNTFLFPPAVVVRLLGRLRGNRVPQSDLKMPPRPANRLLRKLFASEARLLRRGNLPFGISLLATATVPDAAPPADEVPPHAQVIGLDYPVRPRPRFGHGLPPLPQLVEILDRYRPQYQRRLGEILELAPFLHKIAVHDSGAPDEPAWVNGYLPALDGAALYSLLVHEHPTTYLEVGSGNSTRFARRAIRDHNLTTRIVSIDPAPRAEIDAICDEVIRSPLEDTDLAVLDQLGPGDFLFVDNSHRVFTNSDATVVFMEVLPRLPSGVFVHIHDVFLPEDYPAAWNDRFYSEQYLLAAYLLGGSVPFRTEFPAWYIANDPELSALVGPLFEDPAMEGVERHGNSYWLITR